MAIILTLETATPVCSVALAVDGECIGFMESDAPNARSKVLTSFIDEVLKQGGIAPEQLDAVAVSRGPGSYTGLRIGVSAAKGLCYALDIPLLAPDTLQAMAWGALESFSRPDTPPADRLFCPMIDARRMEVYCGIWDNQNQQVHEVEAKIITPDTFSSLLQHHSIVFFGNGSEKCQPMYADHPNALFIKGFRASAAFLIPLATTRCQNGKIENTAYFEPFYLKDFIAGKPNVKGLF